MTPLLCPSHSGELPALHRDGAAPFIASVSFPPSSVFVSHGDTICDFLKIGVRPKLYTSVCVYIICYKYILTHLYMTYIVYML